MKVKRTERGWGAHYCCALMCLFRRNTLLECGKKKIVVSTVGVMRVKEKIEKIGLDRYFETMCFECDYSDTRYYDADTTKEIDFESKWWISEIDADDKANIMHEKVVDEISKKLISGEL
jgi:predicted nucleic-acid-binding Zn-ribbon protein